MWGCNENSGREPPGWKKPRSRFGTRPPLHDKRSENHLSSVTGPLATSVGAPHPEIQVGFCAEMESCGWREPKWIDLGNYGYSSGFSPPPNTHDIA